MRKWVVGAMVCCFVSGLGFGSVVPGIVADLVESQADYGTAPDYAKPWAPESCQDLAQKIALGRFARAVGGKKSLFMESMAAVMEPNSSATEEALGELSLAWDSKESPAAFHRRCLDIFIEHLKPKERL